MYFVLKSLKEMEEENKIFNVRFLKMYKFVVYQHFT